MCPLKISICIGRGEAIDALKIYVLYEVLVIDNAIQRTYYLKIKNNFGI